MSTPPILFDVDGTIFASGELVMNSYQQALIELGIPPLRPETLRKVVGPPLVRSFHELAGVPKEDVDLAVQTYRSIYNPHLLDPPMYDGIGDLIADLHRAGVPLATATTKLEKFAEQQLEHWGLDQYFDVIAGASPDPSSSKTTVVADALARLQEQGVDTEGAILIGDRIHDVEGAEANGISVIGVRWGYGEDSEFDSPVVQAVATDVAELREMLSM